MMNTFAFFILVAFFAPVMVHCRVHHLSGSRDKLADSCPYQRPPVNCDDNHETYCSMVCEAHLKCCPKGCDMECVAPVHYQRWCDAPVDLGILFESQTDVWSTVKRMLNQTIHSKMAITSGHTHVSLKVIGEDNILLKFDQLKGPELNAKKVWDAIQTIQTRRHNGKLSTALVQAKDMFKAKNGGREGAMKILLVFTNANIDLDEGDLVQTAAQGLKDSGILVQSVGISSELLNLFNLVTIATRDIYVWPGVESEMLEELTKLAKEPCTNSSMPKQLHST